MASRTGRVEAPSADPAASPAALVGLVALGGVVGSLGRYAISLALAGVTGGAPLATLAVNVLGCLAIGALLARLDGSRGHQRWRALLGTGVLGGFTTFSGFALDTVDLVDSGAWLAAGGYLAITLLAGVFAPAVGRVLVRGR